MPNIDHTISAVDIAKLIGSHRFRYDTERELQDGIAALLRASEVPFGREVRLSELDIPDFMAGTVAIEVKTAFSKNEVMRQIARYAGHDACSEIVLVTNRAIHLSIPDRLNGKKVVICSLIIGGAL